MGLLFNSQEFNAVNQGTCCGVIECSGYTSYFNLVSKELEVYHVGLNTRNLMPLFRE